MYIETKTSGKPANFGRVTGIAQKDFKYSKAKMWSV